MQGIFWSGDIQDNYIGHICAEIFKDRIYRPFLSDRKDLTILDLGAHVGIFSLYAQKYAKIIYAVEPSIEHFQILDFMVGFNKFKNIKTFKLAISNKNKELQFYHNKNKTMFSLTPSKIDNSFTPEMVKVVTLIKFLDDNKIKKVDFMKMDVEGEEFNIISSDSFTEASKRIDTIVLETHTWVNKKPDQLAFALQDRGYTVQSLKSDANIIVARKL